MAEHEPCIGKTSEWFTPPEIFEALRLIFDLDPAYPLPPADKHCCVPARKFFTQADDGLAQPWRPEWLVFMNPPYGGRRGHVPWLRKFLAHANGIAIVRAYTSSDWWHAEMPRAQLLCFPRGKTRFIRPDGSIGKEPGHGVVLVGMGAIACQALEDSGLGMIWDRQATQRGAP
jgi:DNA N-6-adenine-methyltransferase Dam